MLKLKTGNVSDDEKNNNVSGTDTNDKMLYLFERKEDRDNENMNKAIKIVQIPPKFYNIYEYFPFNNSIEEIEYVVKCNASTRFFDQSKYVFGNGRLRRLSSLRNPKKNKISRKKEL